MSRLTFNMSLDILNGCAYSCVDCSVDKQYPIPTVPEEDTKQLIELAKTIKEDYDAEMFEFTVGPTDLIKSEIGLSALDHPLVTGLLEHFDSIVITLSMLSDDGLVALAKKLDEIAPGKKLRIGIPVTIKNAYNQKYLDMLRKRIKLLKDNMHKCEFYRIYTTVVMTGDSLERFNEEVVDYMSRLKLGVWQTPEWLFGHSRARFDDIITHQRFINDYKEFTRKMAGMVDSDFYIGVVPYPMDGVEVTYRDGKLYYLPYLVEKFHWWHDDLEIPKPWDVDSVLGMKDTIITDNMIDEEHSSDCDGCCHQTNCDMGDVKTIMRMLGVKKCLPDVRDRSDLILMQTNINNRRELSNNG